MANARGEYPRPQFQRAQWQCLNGEWEFELDQGASGEARGLQHQAHLSGRINVPFCPESRLSGIGHVDFIRGCWYRRDAEIPAAWLEGRVLLNFGAVYYECAIFVNGRLAARHAGGHSSFTVDITEYAHAGVNSIAVAAYSDVRSPLQPVGKQSIPYGSAGCSYTRTTGIWQSVWLEPVSARYMGGFRLTPDAANACLDIEIALPRGARGRLTARAGYKGRAVGSAACECAGQSARLRLELDEKHLWDVNAPELYDLRLELDEDGRCVDAVDSYFGLRDICIRDGQVLLNGRPLFQRLILDQGFNPEGIITAPSDEELRADIARSQAMGFNGARMHQKVFEARYLYWADRMGYLLWGEYPNWGMEIRDGNALPRFITEWLEIMKRDWSSPALIGWCPFNETQLDGDAELLRMVYRLIKQLDPSRLCIDTSGWAHCGETDIFDYHDYLQDTATFAEHCAAYGAVKPGEPFALLSSQYPYMHGRAPEYISHGEPVMVSEFGGIGWRMPAEGESLPDNAWGYGNGPRTGQEFIERLDGLTAALLNAKGVWGFCYTQLTDVEQEINGLYTYDRRPKFDPETIRARVARRAWNE